VVNIHGKKKVVTSKARLVIKGTITGRATEVTDRVGKKGAYRLAKYTGADWTFTAKLKPGKNVITVIAQGPGGASAPARQTVIHD
jgi:hypothetical protein